MEILLSAMDGGWRAPAELIDLAARGCRVRVSMDAPLPAAVGASLTVLLTEEASGLELPIEAKLVHRREEPPCRILGIEWLDLRTVGGLLHPKFGQVFNRRAAFRVAPSRSEGAVTVTVSAKGLEPHQAMLVDVSTGGMAVDVPSAFEARLQGDDQVRCAFRVPGNPMLLAGDARIVHRTLRPDGVVRYGIQFQGTENAAFTPTHDALLTYIIRRQRETAEETELMSGTGIPLGALGKSGHRKAQRRQSAAVIKELPGPTVEPGK